MHELLTNDHTGDSLLVAVLHDDGVFYPVTPVIRGDSSRFVGVGSSNEVVVGFNVQRLTEFLL